MEKALSIRNRSNLKYTSRTISRWANRGSALASKVRTVLSDLRYEHNLKSLRLIGKGHVEGLLETYRERVNQGSLSRKTVATYVSALNTVLEYVEREDLKVSAKAWGLSRGSNVYANRANSPEASREFKAWLEEKYRESGNVNYRALAHSVELQRHFGLRARESFGIKLAEKRETDILRLGRGDLTKNARPRDVKIRIREQAAVLEKAKEFAREQGWRSLINPEFNLKEWMVFAYKTPSIL